MTIYEAVNSEKKQIDIKNAAGLFAADFVYAFPPDVPVIIPGEQITQERIDSILELIESGASFRGLDENRVTVVS